MIILVNIILMMVFWPVCTQISITKGDLICAIQNDGMGVISSDASLKSRSEITVWMPWPLNCDLGAELRDFLTTSADKPHIF